jgi:hypothetical protein
MTAARKYHVYKKSRLFPRAYVDTFTARVDAEVYCHNYNYILAETGVKYVVIEE